MHEQTRSVIFSWRGFVHKKEILNGFFFVQCMDPSNRVSDILYLHFLEYLEGLSKDWFEYLMYIK